MEAELLKIVLAIAVTGICQAIITSAVISTKIEFLREGQTRNERSIARAHERIDGLKSG